MTATRTNATAEPKHHRNCARLSASGEFIFPDTACSCGATARQKLVTALRALEAEMRAELTYPQVHRRWADRLAALLTEHGG